MPYGVYSENLKITDPFSDVKEVRDWLKSRQVEVIDIKHSINANSREVFYIIYDGETHLNLNENK